MKDLEFRFRLDCHQAGAITPTWSDLFAHVALGLAVLYDRRGRPKPLDVWLADLIGDLSDGGLQEYIQRALDAAELQDR